MIIIDYDDDTKSSQEQPMYLDRQPIIGDYVERITHYGATMSVGSIWKVTDIDPDGFIVVEGAGDWITANFKVINPECQLHPNYKEPKLEIKPGTHWERLERFSNKSPAGEIITVYNVSSDNRVGWYGPLGHVTRASSEFLEHFKPRPDLDTVTATPTDKRNLAFYKESGEPWTEDELDTVRNYWGDTSNTIKAIYGLQEHL